MPLDVLIGTVLTDCKARHRHQWFLAFLRRIEQAVPAKLDIHLIVDNYSTHKHARVKAWLAKRLRWHLHFIPAYSSRQLPFLMLAACGRGGYGTEKNNRPPPPACCHTVGGYTAAPSGSGLALSYNGGVPVAITRKGAFTLTTTATRGTMYSVAVVRFE